MARVLPALFLLILIGLLEGLGFFEGPDRHFYDLFFRLRGSRIPSREVVIVAVDEQALKHLGRWPIARRYYAELLDRLQRASVVALDILMDESSSEEDDRLLAEAISKHGRVVLPVFIPSYPCAGQARPLFQGAASGHVHVEQGIDGVTREVFHTIYLFGKPIPSLARATVQMLRPDIPHNAPAPNLPAAVGEGFIVQAEPMRINYYGPSGTFQTISAHSILQGLCPPSLIEGKIVLIGLTAPPDDGQTITPFSEDRNRMPAVELHATILNNLLDDSFIRGEKPWKAAGLSLLLIMGGLFLFPRLSPSRLLVVWLGVIALLTLALFGLFVFRFLWIPPTPFYAIAAGSLAIVYVVQLRQTQESLMALQRDWEESFHSIDDAIVLHDERCRLLRMNRAASELPGDRLLKHLEERCRQLKSLGTQGSGMGPSPGKTEAEGIPTEELFDDTADRHYEIRSAPRRNERGQFVGGVHVVRDITRRKQYEREQRELHHMLAQAQKMEAIGTLSGGIAHDFNNILSGIMGYTEIVLRQLPEASPLRDKLDQVLKASSRARDIIQQLLTFSRKGAHQRTTIEMGSLLTEATKLVRVMLPASIEIRQEIHSNGVIHADPTHVHQILLNLATNAFHAMRDTGGVLTLALEDVTLKEPLHLDGQMVRAGPYVKLTVADTGHGIPADVREHIFEPYFTTKKHGEGTGLGLATVRGIVCDYGGLITVDSQPGRGTCFSIFLPRLELPGPREEPAPPDSRMAGHGHVLVVDDELDLTDLMHDMLELLGFTATCCNSPIKALELFQADPQQFSLVITDMSMPGMSGEELARNLTRTRPDIPIILCTGYGDAVVRERGSASGIRKLLTKPFKLQELSKTLDEIVRNGAQT